jgi:hypothetical protein
MVTNGNNFVMFFNSVLCFCSFTVKVLLQYNVFIFLNERDSATVYDTAENVFANCRC